MRRLLRVWRAAEAILAEAASTTLERYANEVRATTNPDYIYVIKGPDPDALPQPLGCTMLRNAVCPYCTTTLVEAENLPNSRSVEHLIPNTVLSKPRKKRDGDFLACRKCNSRKGHIDYVLGVVAKAQAEDSDLAAQTLISAVTSEDGRAQRFIQMAAEATETPHGVMMNIPIFAQELLEYMSFLGRGQYFRKRGKPFDEERQVMVVDFVNKPAMGAFEAHYVLEHGTSPSTDLMQNRYAESFSDGDCIIYSKNDSFLFLFHRYTAITIKIKRRNAKNEERSRASAERLCRYFPWKAVPQH